MQAKILLHLLTEQNTNMAKVVIERFDAGMSDDRYEYSVGQSSVVKGFDILTYPHRLFPTLSSIADTASTGIGNLFTGSDGIIYGLGADVNNPTTNLQMYKKATANSAWAAISNTKGGSSHLNFDLFIEYPDSNNARTIFYANDPGGTMGIVQVDKTAGLSINTIAVTNLESVSQGLVHPKNDILYIPYTTNNSGATTTCIGAYVGSASPPAGYSTGWNAAVLTLPSQLVITSLSWYGNYLAIACAPRGAYSFANTGKNQNVSLVGGSFNSIVYLWDLDAVLATISEVINWGTGILQVLNNLNGRLIGMSNVGGSSVNVDVRASILIKEYAGGVPQPIHEISTDKQTTTQPSVKINPFVNFIYRNRLYFSVDIVGGSTSPNLYGVWSIGKSNTSNQYAIAIEYSATNNNSETSVSAAAITGDYISTVYTAPGTLGFSVVNSDLGTKFVATSYYESCVNPGILLLKNTRLHFTLPKQLQTVSLAFYPLVAEQTITLKYRVDSNSGATGTLGAGWTTIRTYTSANQSEGDTNSGFEQPIRDAAGASFTSGRFYEFRIESVGGAQILEFAYKYELLKSNMAE